MPNNHYQREDLGVVFRDDHDGEHGGEFVPPSVTEPPPPVDATPPTKLAQHQEEGPGVGGSNTVLGMAVQIGGRGEDGKVSARALAVAAELKREGLNPVELSASRGRAVGLRENPDEPRTELAMKVPPMPVVEPPPKWALKSWQLGVLAVGPVIFVAVLLFNLFFGQP